MWVLEASPGPISAFPPGNSGMAACSEIPWEHKPGLSSSSKCQPTPYSSPEAGPAGTTVLVEVQNSEELKWAPGSDEIEFPPSWKTRSQIPNINSFKVWGNISQFPYKQLPIPWRKKLRGWSPRGYYSPTYWVRGSCRAVSGWGRCRKEWGVDTVQDSLSPVVCSSPPSTFIA